MIYTASYFQPENHHGKLLSISKSEPRRFQVDGKLYFFAPSEGLLLDYKAKKIDNESYTDQYRKQMRLVLSQIGDWLRSLKPEEDITLLCWEKKGYFCHRNLVIKFVEKYRPDCFGGCDVPKSTLSRSRC